MKEIMNEFKGIKEPMHTIMEEEEMYEESVYGGSGGEESFGEGESPDKESFESSRKATETGSFNGAEEKKPTYSEEGQKAGSLLFNCLKNDFSKNMPFKSKTRTDTYLDKITYFARKLVQIWFGREISLEDFNQIIDLLKDKNYIVSFPVMLESFRKMNYFQIELSGYQPFCELILICLTEVPFDKKVNGPSYSINPADTDACVLDVLHATRERPDELLDRGHQEAPDIQL